MYDALYARQSLDKKDSISIETQVKTCEHETQGNPFKVYSDKGFSGKNLNRPDFERLTEDIKAGIIKRVIVYKLDRISRSILDFSNLILFFEEYGVEFVSTTEKFDTSTPVGRAMLNICIVFAQLERETIQQRVSDNYHSRSKQGFYMGGKIPYGFKKEGATINGIKTSKLVADVEESSHIKLIYSLYAEENYSLREIIEYFLRNNIKKCRSEVWHSSWISNVLRNPVYVKSDLSTYEFFKSQGAEIINSPNDFAGNGCYLFRGKASASKRQSELKDKMLVLAPHEGFIEPDVWLKCRIKLLNKLSTATIQKSKNSWLIGKTKCGNCGYALSIKKRYAICSNQMNMRLCKGAGGTVYADLLEEYISKAIKDKLAEFDTLSDNTLSEKNPQLEKNKIKIIEIENEINTLLDKVTNANAILLDYINKKVADLDNEKRAIQQENLVIEQAAKRKNFDIVRNHVENWDKASYEDKQIVVDILIEIIHVKDNEIAITWNI